MTPANIEKEFLKQLEKELNHKIEHSLMVVQLKTTPEIRRRLARAELSINLEGYKKHLGKPHPITDIPEYSHLFDYTPSLTRHTDG